MKVWMISCTILTLSCSALAIDQDSPGRDPEGRSIEHTMEHAAAQQHQHHDHGSAVAITYEELTKTAQQLEAAKRATEKYREVRVAEADGYRAIGPDVPGMGIHYVRTRHETPASKDSRGFDVEHPQILLYEKNPAAPGGYALVGVSYLLTADTDTDGQPQNPPFPKSLASWHKHNDLCVFSDGSVKVDSSNEQCQAAGGHFTALTQWMVHAWIWKDSPAGVFSPTNPNVQ